MHLTVDNHIRGDGVTESVKVKNAVIYVQQWYFTCEENKTLYSLYSRLESGILCFNFRIDVSD